MAGEEPEFQPISLFYSYSHDDEELRKRLEKHLAWLRRSGLISEWNDRNIDVGEDWAKEIDRNLTSADIILLLVSASFIASDYCWGVELKRALDRHDKGEARVIPVILRPCRWGATPFAKLQAAPADAKPVTSWPDQDAALDDVASKIERVVTDMSAKRAAAASQALASATRVAAPAAAATPVAEAETLVEAKEAAPASLGEALADFTVFRDVDAPWCPEMVVIPAGQFLMGSPKGEKDRVSNEGPQHKVTIADRFALGRYPVTVGEYRAFVEASGYRQEGGIYVWTGSEWKCDEAKSWRDPGFAQTDRQPVVGVGWRDAQAYVAWLSGKTGKSYRLPSEAEWEYAARAGTTTRYAFGDEITDKEANFGNTIGKTTAVGSYPPNRWGLHDMHGNVWEWVEDVWHDGYKGAPSDGTAWTDGEGKNSSRIRVYRGGSCFWDPGHLRSADRGGDAPDGRIVDLGFRVARTLD
jgi:formylglycine-generating enzyme required for sulfatase activity